MDLLSNSKQQKVCLQDIYSGSTCFFIGAGPSLNQIENLSQKLSQRGILTFAVNNIAAKTIRPNLWCCIDKPKSFHRNIWDDPAILKFTKTENWDHGYNGGMVNTAPNLFWFHLNTAFDTSCFFTESSISCGRAKDHPDNLGISGGRSVMLVALKLMVHLGFKTINLVGCDFHMNEKQPYAFEQTKWAGGIKTNNRMYEIIRDRLSSLIPQLDRMGVNIYNCTPNSKLDIFPYKDLDAALKLARYSIQDNPNLKEMYGETK
jgi:hypothetical protein